MRTGGLRFILIGPSALLVYWFLRFIGSFIGGLIGGLISGLIGGWVMIDGFIGALGTRALLIFSRLSLISITIGIDFYWSFLINIIINITAIKIAIIITVDFIFLVLASRKKISCFLDRFMKPLEKQKSTRFSHLQSNTSRCRSLALPFVAPKTSSRRQGRKRAACWICSPRRPWFFRDTGSSLSLHIS